MLDTGSPITIVSAKFLFQALAKHRLPDQTVKEWEDSVRKRLQYSSVRLQSYGRGKLNIIGQIEVNLERGSNQTKVVVQIQNKAPVELLIGKDLLPSLGVLFLLKEPVVSQGYIQHDLLQNTTWSPLATKPLPAITEQSNAERHDHESSSSAEAMELASVNVQPEKECGSVKISAKYTTTTTNLKIQACSLE